jgi:hypothetical protein
MNSVEANGKVQNIPPHPPQPQIGQEYAQVKGMSEHKETNFHCRNALSPKIMKSKIHTRD